MKKFYNSADLCTTIMRSEYTNSDNSFFYNTFVPIAANNNEEAIQSIKHIKSEIKKISDEDMKKNNHQEYICGKYSEGRYAWILEDIEPISPIKAKGSLNIWQFYNEFEIMNLMENIEYGWIDKNNNKYNVVDESYSDNYILQDTKEIIKNKIGVCWDQVELERYYFKGNDWNIKSYFIVHYDNDKCPTHTFLTFEKNDKYYWFEHAWERFRGIHEYQTQKELLFDVKNKFIKYELNNNYEKNNLIIYNYKKPNYHLNVQEFYRHCESGHHISI